MASVHEDLMAAVLERMQAAPSYGVAAASIRRGHRVPVTRDNAPAVHVVDGDAKVSEDKSCAWHWELDFVVTVFVRDNAGYTAADPFVLEVVARLDPQAGTPYPHKCRLDLLAIRKDTEIADGDAVAVDVVCRFKFGTGGWTLDAGAG